MQSFLAAFLARLIVPPAIEIVLRSFNLDLPARWLPPLREAAKVIFWSGVSQGAWLGYILGILTGIAFARLLQHMSAVSKAMLRLINSRLPPHQRDGRP